jgi:HK97 family phage portal protein
MSMLGTSKMFFGKSIKGRLRNSDIMRSTSSGSTGDNYLDDVFDYQIGRTFMTSAYKVNDWIRAIVDTIVERVDQFDVFPMPLGVKYGTKESDINPTVRKRMEQVMNIFVKPNDETESFSSLKKKVIRDMAIYDEAGMQIVQSVNYLNKKRPYALYSTVSGEEIYVNPNADGTLPLTDAYVQIRGSTKLTYWGKFEFVNFIKNVRSGFSNGLSPIETIAISVMGDIEALNYNLKFFQNNARPNIAFIFENLGFGKGVKALENARKWYNEKHQGKPHLPLFMGSEKGEVKMVEMKMSQKDMDFSGWTNLLLSRIMAVYGVQAGMLGVMTDKTIDMTSQETQFKKNALIPYINVFLNSLNGTLIWGSENFNFDDIYITSVNLDIDDTTKQAEIDEKYLDKGVLTINQVRRKLQMPPVPWGDEPFVPLNYAPFDVLLQWQKSKIESNLKSASSANIDNNIGGDELPQDKPAVKPIKKEMGLTGRWEALYNTIQGEDNYNRFLMKNFKVPTGLEHIEPSIIMEVATALIRERESVLSKSFHSFNGVHSVIEGFDLSWQNVMKK